MKARRTSKLGWGIVGTGRIARTFARGLAASKTGELTAVGSRTQLAADAFGREFGVSRCHGSYADLLADERVDAVYISTPHPMHAEWAIKAAEAGKHVLCEKPIAMNHAEAMAVVEAAIRHDVFLMEAFMYRCHPQTARLIELIRAKAIGDVRVIQATFSFHSPFDAGSRIFKNDLGGGGILDVGCYTTSLARLIAGTATGGDFAEPIEVKGTGHLGRSGVDEYALAVLKFPGDIVAQLAAGVAVDQENVVRIFGTEGHLLVPSPWVIRVGAGASRILVHRRGQSEPEEIHIESDRGLYTLEADVVAAHLDRCQAPPPAMTWDDTLGNMKTLDRWRDAIGLVYDSEKPGAQTLPVHKRPLAVRKDASMKYNRLPGVDLPVSRVVMGVDNQTAMPHAAVMFDDFFERGGNAFDTAHIYGGGQCERVLGQWIEDRGIRDKVVVLGKGAHTPWCNPADLTAQLGESLDRMKTDYVDLYLLHRDNPDVPVGEFIDVLNEHRSAGRMRAFGVSNWTRERFEAGNEYARAEGVTGLAVLSNQLSLARMVEPPWPGCLSAGDAGSRAWLARRQIPLLAWSSQARGFFADPPCGPNAEFIHCWASDDNFERRRRAIHLAEHRKTLPTSIALAYVLGQPFPTFALIGPRTLAETRTSLPALEIELAPDELRWLNLDA